MIEIRKDIFPKMISFLEAKDITIAKYIDQAFEAFSEVFSSKDEFIKYINSLENHETAELFIKICKFHSITKKYQPTSYVKLIMIISAIERITNKDRPYQEFYFWIDTQRTKITEELSKKDTVNERVFRKIIAKLREDYFTIYGSRRNVLDFFQNHLSVENKIKLIKSIRVKWTNSISQFCFQVHNLINHPFPQTIEEAGKMNNKEVRMSLMPYCYDWKKCWIEVGCIPSVYCPLLENENLLDIALKKVVTDIYQMRNDFVHSAKIMPLSENNTIGILSVVGKERKPVSIELTAHELETIFENGLKHYFDEFTA